MYGLGIGFDFDWAFQVYLNLRLRDQVVYLSASSPFLFVFFLETSAFQFWSSPSSLLDSSQSISQSIFSRKPNRLLVLPLRRTSSTWAWKLWSQLQVNSIIVLGCSTITDQAKAKEPKEIVLGWCHWWPCNQSIQNQSRPLLETFLCSQFGTTNLSLPWRRPSKENQIRPRVKVGADLLVFKQLWGGLWGNILAILFFSFF